MQDDDTPQNGLVLDLQPPSASSALVRKLGSLCLLSLEEIRFLEGLQNNTIEVKSGVDFIYEGDDRKITFIIIDGWSIQYTLLSNGRRQIISYGLPGDILGLHINFRARATCSSAALGALRLAAVDPLRILEIHQKYPILASGLSWCTAREFSILGDQAVRLGRLSAKARLAHFFLELWHRLELIGANDGDVLEMPMRQRDLADTLGLSVVHINRSLAALRADGLITTAPDHVRLNDMDALIRIAEFNADHLTEFQV